MPQLKEEIFYCLRQLSGIRNYPAYKQKEFEGRLKQLKAQWRRWENKCKALESEGIENSNSFEETASNLDLETEDSFEFKEFEQEYKLNQIEYSEESKFNEDKEEDEEEDGKEIPTPILEMPQSRTFTRKDLFGSPFSLKRKFQNEIPTLPCQDKPLEFKKCKSMNKIDTKKQNLSQILSEYQDSNSD